MKATVSSEKFQLVKHCWEVTKFIKALAGVYLLIRPRVSVPPKCIY